MRPLATAIATIACAFIITSCSSGSHAWQSMTERAIPGAGAISGKDYINGLLPNLKSKEYFSAHPAPEQPWEIVTRSNHKTSESGVRFVEGNGILIPPGVTIAYHNHGYCMDPHLPAPKARDEYQLVPMARLIPEELQTTYHNMLLKASRGELPHNCNMQHLVWALRTAGTDAAYSSYLRPEQLAFLDSCSEHPGLFRDFHNKTKLKRQIVNRLAAVADSYLNVNIGGVTYKASDLLNPNVGPQKIDAHLNQLIDMSKLLPVEQTGFNFGELQTGIYTNIIGTGSLAFHASIANSTDKPFIYYPQQYVGQVGSGVRGQVMSLFASGYTGMRQRTTQAMPEELSISGLKRKLEDLPTEERQRLEKELKKLEKDLRREKANRGLLYDLKHLITGMKYGLKFQMNKAMLNKTQGGMLDGRMKSTKDIRHLHELDGWVVAINPADDIKEIDKNVIIALGTQALPGRAGVYAETAMDLYHEVSTVKADLEKQEADWKRHKQARINEFKRRHNLK